MIVDASIRSILLDKIKVLRATRRDDLETGKLGKLDGKEPDARGSAVDEEPSLALDFGGRVRDVEALVESLTGRAEADSVDGGFAKGYLG